MIFVGRWKYVLYETYRPMLYDLLTDPHEFHDLGASDAPEHRQVAVAHLRGPAERAFPLGAVGLIAQVLGPLDFRHADRRALRRGLPPGWRLRLEACAPEDLESGWIWLHAVSVGEVNLLQTLLTRFEERHPEWDVVISTTTRTGFELAQKKYGGRTIFYSPPDFSWAVSSALRRVRPPLPVLAELEVWPNLVALAKRQGVKVAVVNGRLSEKSFDGYRRARWLLADTFRALDLVAAQNDEYAERFTALGARPDSVQITGSLKFDGAISDLSLIHISEPTRPY